jgi:hypothetical protein
MLAVAEAEDAFLGAALLFVAAGAPERRVEAIFVERLLQSFRLPHVGVERAMIKRIDCLPFGFRVLVDEKLGSSFAADLVAKRVHVPELPRRVDMKQRKGQRARKERLLREVKHHRRILADRVKHHGPVGLRDGLAQDVDALGFEPIEMRECPHRSYQFPASGLRRAP